MKHVLGLIIIVIGICLAAYVPLVVMLYGGIMQAIENWGTNNSAVVWGIIRAVLCEAGVIPGYLLMVVGMAWIKA